MAVRFERTAFKFKFNPNFFPSVLANPSSGNAIWETSLNGFDLKVEGIVQNAEKIHNAEFVHGRA